MNFVWFFISFPVIYLGIVSISLSNIYQRLEKKHPALYRKYGSPKIPVWKSKDVWKAQHLMTNLIYGTIKLPNDQKLRNLANNYRLALWGGVVFLLLAIFGTIVFLLA